MKQLLVVYHSMTGAAEQLARAAVAGAGDEPDVQVRLLRAPDAGSADVLAADGYLFATPENLASMAGLMKDFFDRIYYDALDRVNGRPYAVIIAAGTDGAIDTGRRKSATMRSARRCAVSARGSWSVTPESCLTRASARTFS